MSTLRWGGNRWTRYHRVWSFIIHKRHFVILGSSIVVLIYAVKWCLRGTHMVQWDTLLPENKTNILQANPLPTFYVSDSYHRKTETLDKLFWYYTTLQYYSPPPLLSVRVGWWEKNDQSLSTTACPCSAFPCAVPGAHQCTSHRTNNHQPYALSQPSNHITPLSPTNSCLANTQTSYYSKLLWIYLVSLCYIWRKNCGINLRSKIMPTRHTHDTKG